MQAGHWKHWGLVRHTAGLLKKRVEELALVSVIQALTFITLSCMTWTFKKKHEFKDSPELKSQMNFSDQNFPNVCHRCQHAVVIL